MLIFPLNVSYCNNIVAIVVKKTFALIQQLLCMMIKMEKNVLTMKLIIADTKKKREKTTPFSLRRWKKLISFSFHFISIHFFRTIGIVVIIIQSDGVTDNIQQSKLKKKSQFIFKGWLNKIKMKLNIIKSLSNCVCVLVDSNVAFSH
ncbi:hypothetical protein ACKWTF_003872 [Chironomus riparius]